MAEPIPFDRALAQIPWDYLELLSACGDFGILVQEAMQDMALRERLLRAPGQVLLEKRLALPADTKIDFLASSSQRPHSLVRSLMDGLEYQRQEGRNRLVLRKALV